MVGALVNAVFLVALCFSIFVDAMKRFLEMEEIRNPKLILVVGSVGLTINLVREVMKTFPIYNDLFRLVCFYSETWGTVTVTRKGTQSIEK